MHKFRLSHPLLEPCNFPACYFTPFFEPYSKFKNISHALLNICFKTAIFSGANLKLRKMGYHYSHTESASLKCLLKICAWQFTTFNSHLGTAMTEMNETARHWSMQTELGISCYSLN